MPRRVRNSPTGPAEQLTQMAKRRVSLARGPTTTAILPVREPRSAEGGEKGYGVEGTPGAYGVPSRNLTHPRISTSVGFCALQYGQRAILLASLSVSGRFSGNFRVKNAHVMIYLYDPDYLLLKFSCWRSCVDKSRFDKLYTANQRKL